MDKASCFKQNQTEIHPSLPLVPFILIPYEGGLNLKPNHLLIFYVHHLYINIIYGFSLLFK